MGKKPPKKPINKTENKTINNTRGNKLLCGKGMVMMEYRSEANNVYKIKNIINRYWFKCFMFINSYNPHNHPRR